MTNKFYTGGFKLIWSETRKYLISTKTFHSQLKDFGSCQTYSWISTETLGTHFIDWHGNRIFQVARMIWASREMEQTDNTSSLAARPLTYDVLYGGQKKTNDCTGTLFCTGFWNHQSSESLELVMNLSSLKQTGPMHRN